MRKRERRTVGNIHLRGEPTEIEPIDLTSEMRDLIRRRTDWIVRDMVLREYSVRRAVETAYLAGVNDATDATTTV